MMVMVMATVIIATSVNACGVVFAMTTTSVTTIVTGYWMLCLGLLIMVMCGQIGKDAVSRNGRGLGAMVLVFGGGLFCGLRVSDGSVGQVVVVIVGVV